MILSVALCCDNWLNRGKNKVVQHGTIFFGTNISNNRKRETRHLFDYEKRKKAKCGRELDYMVIYRVWIVWCGWGGENGCPF